MKKIALFFIFVALAAVFVFWKTTPNKRFFIAEIVSVKVSVKPPAPIEAEAAPLVGGGGLVPAPYAAVGVPIAPPFLIQEAVETPLEPPLALGPPAPPELIAPPAIPTPPQINTQYIIREEVKIAPFYWILLIIILILLIIVALLILWSGKNKKSPRS